MRRGTTLSLAVIVAFFAVVSATPVVLAQEASEPRQDQESSFEGITVAPTDDARLRGEKLQLFEVTFEPSHYVPERTYPESMVVKVQSGTFVLRVQSEVLVDPEGEAIPIVAADPPIPLGSNPNENREGRIFKPEGTVDTCSGSAPNTLCLLDPDVLKENFVELNEGDLVYLPDDTTCFFCNTTGSQAELLVWTPSTGFSWHRLYESERATAASTPVAQQQGARAVQSWMFNPGGRCN